jgi:hypothetical protein
MSNPVELRLVTSNSFPSGTGSFDYQGEFEIVVENLAFQKNIGIRGATAGGPTFIDHPATFQESLPDGRELWKLKTGDELLNFVARYEVLGNTFWDNNGGANYKQPQVFDEFDAMLGSVPEVASGTAGFSDATNISLLVAVKNIGFVKQVGIVFTTDGWVSSGVAFGTFDHTLKSGDEVWKVSAGVGSATRVDFAIFYRVNGQEFWDNNFWRNYVLTR